MPQTELQIKIAADAKSAISSLGDVSRSVESLRGSFAKLTAAVALGNAAFAAIGASIKGIAINMPRALLDGALAAERMQRAFSALEGSLSAARDQIRFVTAEANRLGIPLEAASDAWLNIAAAARGTALEGESARKIFSAVAGAASTLGLSASETSGALLAISQMMSKGTVQAEELRGQLGERIPGAFQIAARAMGVTTQALSDMLDRGELLATDFLPRFADQLAREIPASADGTQGAINRLSNAIEQWRQMTGSALAVAIDGFFDLKRASGEVGNDDSIVEFSRKSAKAIAALMDVVRELVLFVPNVIRTIGGSVAAVARDIKLAFDVATIAVTEGIGAKGRESMRRALEDRNRFIEAYNDDMSQRWFPKQLTTRVDEFFGDLAKRTADASKKASAYVGAELTKEQQKTIDALRSAEEKLQAEYKTHANNLYAALTSGAIDTTRYNELRARLEQWYAEQKRKLVKAGGFSLASSQLAATKDAIDAELIVLKDGLARAKAAYDAALEDRLISIKEYYAAKTAIEQREIDAEIARQQQLLDEQRAIAADPRASEADRIRAKGEVAKIEAELIALNNKRADVEQANARKAAAAERELADALAQAREELARITGTATAEDRRAAIERSYRDLKARLAAEGDTAGVSLVDKLINVKAAQANLEALESQWRLVIERMRNAQESIRTQQEAGLLTETQARQQIVALQQQSAAEMERLLPMMQQAAEAIGPEAVVQVAAWRNELERTKLVVDDVATTINGAVQDAFTQMFESIGNGAKSAKEAFIDFVRSVLAAINRITSQKLAEALLGSMFGSKGGGVGGLGGFISGLFKGFSHGGYVTGPGTSTSDSIPARLSAGEYVIRADAVKRVGVAFLDAINGGLALPRLSAGRLAFAAGGLVPDTQPPMQPQGQTVRIVNVIDPSMAADYLNSSAGERTILNVLSRNASAVRELLR